MSTLTAPPTRPPEVHQYDGGDGWHEHNSGPHVLIAGDNIGDLDRLWAHISFLIDRKRFRVLAYVEWIRDLLNKFWPSDVPIVILESDEALRSHLFTFRKNLDDVLALTVSLDEKSVDEWCDAFRETAEKIQSSDEYPRDNSCARLTDRVMSYCPTGGREFSPTFSAEEATEYFTFVMSSPGFPVADYRIPFVRSYGPEQTAPQKIFTRRYFEFSERLKILLQKI